MVSKSAIPMVFLLCSVILFAGEVRTATAGYPEFTISAQNFDEYQPSVAYNSVRDEYFVVWHENSPLQGRSVLGRRYTAAGTFIAEYVIAFEDTPPRDHAQPSVAYDPVRNRYLVVWIRDFYGDGSDWDVHGRIVPWDGPSVSEPIFVVDDVAGSQWNPKVAYGGTVQEFMVTWWMEAVSGTAASIYAQRLNFSGVSQGGTITVTSHATEERVAPDIAYNQARNEYVIAYQKMDAGGGHIYGVRLSGTGTILGGGDFGIAAWPDAETAPSIAASRVSNTWAVAWQSLVGASDKDIYMRFVSVDGTGTVQLSSPVLVASTPLHDSTPDIAAHPEESDFLIAYEGQYSDVSGPYGIFAKTITSSSQLSDEIEVKGLPIGNDSTCYNPEIGSGRSDWLVAWENDRNATPTYRDIHGRIIQNGIFLDGFEEGGTAQWTTVVP